MGQLMPLGQLFHFVDCPEDEALNNAKSTWSSGQDKAIEYLDLVSGFSTARGICERAPFADKTGKMQGAPVHNQ